MPKVRRLSVDPYLKRMRGKTPRSRSVPVARGAVVDVRKSSFTVRGIVVGVIPPTDFSRAYGRQVMVCDMKGREPHIWEVGAGDAIVRGDGTAPYRMSTSPRSGFRWRSRQGPRRRIVTSPSARRRRARPTPPCLISQRSMVCRSRRTVVCWRAVRRPRCASPTSMRA